MYRLLSDGGMEMIMERVCINSISKKIDDFQILKLASISVEKSEICALIGPNGAGKTTLLNCLLGLLSYDGGSIRINDIILDKSHSREKILSQIGSVMQYPDSISGMTIKELFEDHFHYLNMADCNVTKFLELVKLNVNLDYRIEKLSLGMRQRLLFALSISHGPDILILDEPFNGLDPDGLFLMKSILLEFKSNGGSAIIASHSLKELEDFSDSVVFIKDGVTAQKCIVKEILSKNPGGLQEYYKNVNIIF